jgi:hypothetical protein
MSAQNAMPSAQLDEKLFTATFFQQIGIVKQLIDKRLSSMVSTRSYGIALHFDLTPFE